MFETGVYRLERPNADDDKQVLALMNACDIAEYGEPDSDLEDLRQEWAEIDLGRDAWLVEGPAGALLGYAAVLEDRGIFRYDLYARPEHSREGLQAAMLELCLARSRERLAQQPGEVVQNKARVYVAHVNRPDREALESAGFAPARYHFRMQIDMTAPPEPPRWPEGFTLRSHRPGEDDRRVYDFIESAFARPGREPASFDDWRAYMMREDHFRPDLWHLLFDGEVLVGAALCFAYPLYGWIRQLGVEPGHRRQGIGTGLLHRSFTEFYRRGQPAVALGVEATNADAYRLYERAGMRRVRQYDEYVGEF